MSAAAMLALTRMLEEGRHEGPVARLLARAWGEVAARRLRRRLAVPPGVRVVTVGGATLGGSGKTPLAIACARELALRGVRVAFVGHAYGARPGRARIVACSDAEHEVGDEALVAARALQPHHVPVVVAPRRSGAVARASTEADVLVMDGVLQTEPVRASLALLAVDADEPWGRAAAVPPCGDLRAPVAALVSHADVVVRVGESSPSSPSGRAASARVVSRGVHLDRTRIGWDELRYARVGLACALARPDRVLRFLQSRGVVPVAVARAPDHAPIPARHLSARVDLWLATPKCATHVPAMRAGCAPVATIDHDVVLCPSLCARLLCAAAP
jgi:tetraacyldisaccharide 4'-kinase